MINKKTRSSQKTAYKLPKGIEQYWSYEQINDTQYILRLKANITQTGSEFNTDYQLPIHHRVMEISAYHYDAAGALNTSAATFKWYTLDGANWRILWNKTNAGYSAMSQRYQDEVNGGTDFNPTTHRFTTNAAAGHLIAVSMRIEVLKW